MRARSGERFGDLGETIGAMRSGSFRTQLGLGRLASLGSPSFFAFPPLWPMVAMSASSATTEALPFLPASDVSSGLKRWAWPCA